MAVDVRAPYRHHLSRAITIKRREPPNTLGRNSRYSLRALRCRGGKEIDVILPAHTLCFIRDQRIVGDTVAYAGFAPLECDVALDEFAIEPFALDDLVADRVRHRER